MVAFDNARVAKVQFNLKKETTLITQKGFNVFEYTLKAIIFHQM